MSASFEQVLTAHLDFEEIDLDAVDWYVVTEPAPEKWASRFCAQQGVLDWNGFVCGQVLPVHREHHRSVLDGRDPWNSWVTVTKAETFEDASALRIATRLRHYPEGY